MEPVPFSQKRVVKNKYLSLKSISRQLDKLIDIEKTFIKVLFMEDEDEKSYLELFHKFNVYWIAACKGIDDRNIQVNPNYFYEMYKPRVKPI